MTRGLLASLMILWDILDDYSLEKAWVQTHGLATRITKKQNGLRVGRHNVTRPRVDAGGGLRSDKMV